MWGKSKKNIYYVDEWIIECITWKEKQNIVNVGMVRYYFFFPPDLYGNV